jgi:hypothetical protein
LWQIPDETMLMLSPPAPAAGRGDDDGGEETA